MAKTSPSKIVIDLSKCNKRACIFERTKKQNKVDPLNGLVIGNHPYFRTNRWNLQRNIESMKPTEIEQQIGDSKNNEQRIGNSR